MHLSTVFLTITQKNDTNDDQCFSQRDNAKRDTTPHVEPLAALRVFLCRRTLAAFPTFFPPRASFILARPWPGLKFQRLFQLLSCGDLNRGCHLWLHAHRLHIFLPINTAGHSSSLGVLIFKRSRCWVNGGTAVK